MQMLVPVQQQRQQHLTQRAPSCFKVVFFTVNGAFACRKLQDFPASMVKKIVASLKSGENRVKYKERDCQFATHYEFQNFFLEYKGRAKGVFFGVYRNGDAHTFPVFADNQGAWVYPKIEVLTALGYQDPAREERRSRTPLTFDLQRWVDDVGQLRESQREMIRSMPMYAQYKTMDCFNQAGLARFLSRARLPSAQQFTETFITVLTEALAQFISWGASPVGLPHLFAEIERDPALSADVEHRGHALELHRGLKSGGPNVTKQVIKSLHGTTKRKLCEAMEVQEPTCLVDVLKVHCTIKAAISQYEAANPDASFAEKKNAIQILSNGFRQVNRLDDPQHMVDAGYVCSREEAAQRQRVYKTLRAAKKLNGNVLV